MIESAMVAGPAAFYFNTRPRNITTNPSNRVEFQCSIHSIFTQNFKWNFTSLRKGSREAETIAAIGRAPSAGYSIAHGHRSQVLIISSVQWRHNGVYTCIVSSESRGQFAIECAQ